MVCGHSEDIIGLVVPKQWCQGSKKADVWEIMLFLDKKVEHPQSLYYIMQDSFVEMFIIS